VGPGSNVAVYLNVGLRPLSSSDRGYAGIWMSVAFECCVLSGRGLSVGPIPGPEESYRVRMTLSVIRYNNNHLRLQ
jgi:hypothetical protein